MAHNLVYFDSSTNTIQKFSNAQLDNLAERVLRVMAAGTYTGTITVGTTASIGTFADTALVDTAGGTNTTTVTNTYTLSQVATATLGATSDPPMYVGLDTTSPTQTVLQENLTTKEQLADEIIARMVASTGGTNAYYLATSAPADGATWVSRGTLLDTKTNLTVTVTDYKLWQRTTSGASITNRDPVKLSSGNIQSFSTAEINALIKTIEERIVATGIGTYALQASAPATGTWTNVGTVVDTREDITTSNFTGTDSYVNEDAIAYTSTYVGTRNYIGDDVATYVTTYSGPASYLGPTTYLGPSTYNNADVTTYTDSNATSFNLSYQNNYVADYEGGNYAGGPFPFGQVGPFPTPQGGSIPYSGDRTYTFPFTNPYFGNYQATYLGPANYLGPADYINENAISYTNENAISFTNVDAINFNTTYLGPIGFTTAFTSFDGSNYSGPITYVGTVSYEGTRVAPTTSTISTRTLWRRIA